MSGARRIRRLIRPSSALAVLAALGALGPVLVASPASAAATPSAHTAFHSAAESNALAYSADGYVATGSTTSYTRVSAAFVQPPLSCSSSSLSTADWVGLDGYTGPGLEQVGTEVDCASGTSTYYAWYDTYPVAPVTIAGTIKAGDGISLSVAFSGSKSFTFTVADTTRGWSKTVTQSVTASSHESAEIITNPPAATGSGAPPSGLVTFTGCQVNGRPLGSFDLVQLTAPGITVTPITDGATFSIVWGGSAGAGR